MTKSLFVSSGYRTTLRKLAAGFLMLSINLTGGLGALFLTTEVAYAVDARPDLTITKTHEGNTYLNGSFKWKLRVANVGNADAVFGKNNTLLHDNMPSVGVNDYGSPTYTTSSGVSVIGSISCTQGGSDNENLTCKVSNTNGDSVRMAPSSFFDVFVDVNPNSVGTLTNPRSQGICVVDKANSSGDSIVDESNENNNTCSNSVTVINSPKTLEVTKTGSTGLGTVSATGINCDVANTDCSETYTHGTNVTLSAVAAVGSTFTGWSGSGCSGINLCFVSMTAAKTVNATFTLNSYLLTAAKIGNGSGAVSSNPAGINFGDDSSESYTHGTAIVMTATPATGSTFAGWSGGGCTGTGSTCTVTLTAATTVTASFTLNSYGVTAAKAGNGDGTITSTPAGINCGTACNEIFSFGALVTLSASSMTGSTFAGWSGGVCSGAICSFIVDAAKSVIGTFTLNTHTLNVGTVGLGSVSSSPGLGISCPGVCMESYAHGTDVTLIPTPSTGYAFFGWSGACTGSGSCVVDMTEAREVVATFSAIPAEPCPSGTTGPGVPNCAPIPPQSCEENTSTMTRVSSTTDVTVGTPTGGAAVAVGFIHSEWTASIPGATWIWSESPVSNIAVDHIESFFDVFTVAGTPTGGTLTVAGDNSFEVYLNGTQILQDSSGTTFGSAVSTSTGVSLVGGQNTLEFRVKNWGVGSTQANPAGLLYSLTVNKNACVPVVAPVCEQQVNLIENGGFEVPTVLSWEIIPFTNAALKWLGAFVTPGGLGRFGLELQAGVAGAPHNGSAQLAELDGDHPTRIYQDVATIPGNDYSLTYFFSPRPDTPISENILEVAVGGTVIDTHTGTTSGNTVWTPHTKTFVATATVTRVAFADIGNDDSGSTGGLGSYLDDVKFSCVGVHVPKATVVATKIVCDAESYLPDWSGQSHVIGATTAADFVAASGGKCRIAPEWKFQWSPTSAGNPGDNVTGEVSGWTTFTSSAVITLGSMTSVWVREVYDAAYVAFAGITNTNPVVSAEMYCNGDVYHYDNLDYANGLTDGGTVYCVAFNALKPVADTSMSVTVIKHVINNNGGTKDAEDFTLHIRQPAVDMCTNVDGMQETVPVEMYREGGMCFPYSQNTLNTIFDWFSVKTAYAMPIMQVLFSPQTFQGSEGGTMVSVAYETDYVVTEDADALYTTTYSADCTGHVSPGQHKTCTVTNNDIAPVVSPPGGGGGSSTFDYWGCTNPSASNFNALANRDDNSCKIGGGNGGGSEIPPLAPQGEVLGASTAEPELPLPAGCSAYILTYQKLGRKNDVEDVKRLQTFLNESMSANLPVSGLFGSMTKSWVKKFQKAHSAEIIQPWIDAGHDMSGLKDGSGVVYKTTKRAINIAKCATLNEPMPDLANDGGMTN